MFLLELTALENYFFSKTCVFTSRKKYSVVIAAADTFRAGAIEQLREHANRLNLKLVAQNYESDPAAVARDAVLYQNPIKQIVC